MDQKVQKKVVGMNKYFHNMQTKGLEKFYDIISQQLKLAGRKLMKIKQEGFAAWVVRALENGAGAAHRFTHQTPKAPPLPCYIQKGEVVLFDPIENAIIID